MMFSRLARSIARSSRSRNVLSGRSQILTVSVYESRVNGNGDESLRILRRFLGSLAGNKDINGGGLSSKVCVSDISCVLANPRFRRFFSSEAPKKKNYENFYPKEKKETPKGITRNLNLKARMNIDHGYFLNV
ncbi:hypothetical protein HanXRQr2_Chr14g0640681 [Helianthus annuus]|uniref:Uncharacterized protein n=1 Tax=Helianthus annuus TaxID=4232 RepID=A0A9K3H610_HELAN|nr:hypothetical protein HanXRQr2_Chr14g0640681 [Helianthus annuus]